MGDQARTEWIWLTPKAIREMPTVENLTATRPWDGIEVIGANATCLFRCCI
jgi:hypothetical protein